MTEQYKTTRKEAKEAEDKYYLGKACKRNHSGLREVSNGHCLECNRIWALSYWKRNKEKVALSHKAYVEQNKDKIRSKYREYYLKNRPALLDKAAKYRSEHRQELAEWGKKYREENREKVRERRRLSYIKNREARVLYYRKYREKNQEVIKKSRHTEEFKEYQNSYMRWKRRTDPLFRLSSRIRSRVIRSIKAQGFKKTSLTSQILGCDWETLKLHLERQFQEGMSWENIGQWHIDHVHPLAQAKTEEELLALCHYSNLQPLWATDNFSKGRKPFVGPLRPSNLA